MGVIHHENPTPAGLNVWRGGANYFDVVMHREGITSPITLTAENLPQGLHCQATTIPADSRGVLVFWSDANAPEWTGSLHLFASYRRGEQTIKQAVRPYTRVWNDAQGTSRPTRELAASLRETAPFFAVPERETLEAKPGDKIELKVKIERLWPEFTGDLKLLPLGFPGNFQMPELPVAAGATEATVTITVQEGTPPNEFTLALLAQAQVPFNKDAAAKEKPNTLVSLPSRPFTIRVLKTEKEEAK